MDEFRLRQIELHGHEVTYRLAGEGSSLLMIHGLAGSSRTWRDVMPTLADHHRVLAPDLLGHGESAKPMGDYSLGAYASGLRDLIGALGLGRVTVVGQSFGGGIAMQLAYQHPEIVERLVLVGTGGLGREVSWLLRVLTLPGAEFVMPLVFPRFVRDRGDVASAFLHRHGVRAPQVGEMWRAYASICSAENRGAFVRTIQSVIDPGGQTVSALDRLYLAAHMPTMIVWGSDDPVIPIEHAYAALEVVPDARLEVFEGVGHFPHVEAPERFVEVLLDFVASTRPSHIDAQQYQELLGTRAG